MAFIDEMFACIATVTLELENQNKIASSWDSFLTFCFSPSENYTVPESIFEKLKQKCKKEVESLKLEQLTKLSQKYNKSVYEIKRKEERYISGKIDLVKPPKKPVQKSKPISANEMLVSQDHPLVQEIAKIRHLDIDYEYKYLQKLRTVEIPKQIDTSGLREVHQIPIVEEEEEPQQSLADVANILLWRAYLLRTHEDTKKWDGSPRPNLTLHDRVMMKRITRRLKGIMEADDISDERKEEAINNFMRHSLAFQI